jgi:hypothetical protein
LLLATALHEALNPPYVKTRHRNQVVTIMELDFLHAHVTEVGVLEAYEDAILERLGGAVETDQGTEH